MQERIKDYIAQPKSNGYQSLHTTVFGPGRQLYEIQIRTRDMHRTADYGIAAHWRYKEDAKSADELDRHLSWFRQVLELQLDAKTPDEFLEFLKLDLYQDEIFVFTPTGDVIQLPEGRDAARLRVRGAHRSRAALQRREVNGRIAPLSRAAAQLGDGRDHHVADGAAEPRLARARPHRARAPQDPPVAPARGADAVGEARAGDARARAQAPALAQARRCAPRRRRRRRSGSPTSTHLLASIGQGDVNVTLALKHLFPERERREPPKPSTIERLVDRVRGRRRACASRASTG